jgi:hypothetical protein
MKLITIAQAMKQAGRRGPTSLAQQDAFVTKYSLTVVGTIPVKGKDARCVDLDRLNEALKHPTNTKSDDSIVHVERELIEIKQQFVELAKVVAANTKTLTDLIRLENLQSDRLNELVKMWNS